MVNTINSQPDLDFARKWWNKVRQNSGTILTKPVIRRKLEKQVKELTKKLEENPAQQDLNLILNRWTFDNQPPQTAQEFLTKFGDWINKQSNNKKNWDEFLTQQGVDNLKELEVEITRLKNTKSNQKITNLENKLADAKAELKKSQEQVKSLSQIKEGLENQITNAINQIDGLLTNLKKGIIDKNWKKEISNYIGVIKDLLTERDNNSSSSLPK